MTFSTDLKIFIFFSVLLYAFYALISYDYIIITKNFNTYLHTYNYYFMYDSKILLKFDTINFFYGFYLCSFIYSYTTYADIHKSNVNLLKCIKYMIHCSIIDVLLAPLHIINIFYNIIYISLHAFYYKIIITPDYILEQKLNRTIINTSFIEQKPDCCPICYDSFHIHDKPLSCGHYIHRNCIVLSKQTKCSICRSEIVLYRQELHTIINHNDYLNISRNSDCPLLINVIDYIFYFRPTC